MHFERSISCLFRKYLQEVRKGWIYHVALVGRGLYIPAKLQNHWSAFGDICQLSGTWMAPNSKLIEKNTIFSRISQICLISAEFGEI